MQDESTYYNEYVNRNVRQHSRDELMTTVKSDDEEEGSTYEQFDNKLTVKPINCSSESASRCLSVIKTHNLHLMYYVIGNDFCWVLYPVLC